MLCYTAISTPLKEKILADQAAGWKNPYRCENSQALRRQQNRDKHSLERPAFSRDVDKILHSPFYNRYADKTQVFSFYRNDDITRRALHVQLVSRIARSIGSILGLNLDLIEAIALGHDIGHAPFGHAGERFLDWLLSARTGRRFCHNVHSVRVLDRIFRHNLTLQTLDGILCHNGEFEQQEYRPEPLDSFAALDQKTEACYLDAAAVDRLVPSTLEGCVVRICDMIAYLGKDRQDARKARLLADNAQFTKGAIGVENAEIIHNLVVNIVENSYGKDYLLLDSEIYAELKTAKRENYELIYRNEGIDRTYNESVWPMFEAVYDALLKDLKAQKESSVIFRHHIDYVESLRGYYVALPPYREEEPNQVVVDYIASMTDDYFVDLYRFLFPNGKYRVDYVPYFEDMKEEKRSSDFGHPEGDR